MTIQLRPLHRWKRSVYDHNGDRTRHLIQYGNGLYITNGGGFFIIKDAGVWKVSPKDVHGSVAFDLDQTGLFDARFPRQADAIEALQITLDTVAEVNE